MKKILVVEDEEALGKILSEELSDEGFEVKHLTEGGKAVFDEAASSRLDFILLDLNLPKMDGLATLKGLKADEATKDIPVMIFSSLEQDEKIKEALSLGAIDYFIKSDHPMKEAVEKVKHYLLSH